MMFGAMTLESQGLGILFAAMTDWDIKTRRHRRRCAGYRLRHFCRNEGSRLAQRHQRDHHVCRADPGRRLHRLSHLPGDGYDSVAEYYTSSGQSHMISIWGTSPRSSSLLRLQRLLPSCSARQPTRCCSRSRWRPKTRARFADRCGSLQPVNGLFAVFAVILGLAAKSVSRIQRPRPQSGNAGDAGQLVAGLAVRACYAGVVHRGHPVDICNGRAGIVDACSAATSTSACIVPTHPRRKSCIVTRTCIVFCSGPRPLPWRPIFRRFLPP